VGVAGNIEIQILKYQEIERLPCHDYSNIPITSLLNKKTAPSIGAVLEFL